MSKFKAGDKVVGNKNMEGVGNVGRKAVVEKYDGDGTVTGKWEDGHRFRWILGCKFDLVPVVAPTRPAKRNAALPLDSAERKNFPLFSGLLAYFPAALAQVSNHSKVGNDKHNPGLPLQHARGVSGDHADCILRHLVDAAEYPAGSPQRVEELRALCWRGLALLQEECELTFAPAAPAASFDRVGK